MQGKVDQLFQSDGEQSEVDYAVGFEAISVGASVWM